MASNLFSDLLTATHNFPLSSDLRLQRSNSISRITNKFFRRGWSTYFRYKSMSIRFNILCRSSGYLQIDNEPMSVHIESDVCHHLSRSCVALWIWNGTISNKHLESLSASVFVGMYLRKSLCCNTCAALMEKLTQLHPRRRLHTYTRRSSDHLNRVVMWKRVSVIDALLSCRRCDHQQ